MICNKYYFIKILLFIFCLIIINNLICFTTTLINKNKYEEKQQNKVIIQQEEERKELLSEKIYIKKYQSTLVVDEDPPVRQSVADLAKDFVGVTQYVSAGRSLYATDCSGFVHMLYAQFNVYASPGSDNYMAPYDFGYFISENELQPGDIVVYRNGGHVAIYEGDNMIIHCASPESGTYWESMYFDVPSAFVRINEL